MGELVRFPQELRASSPEDVMKGPAVVVVLPIVRVERMPGRLPRRLSKATLAKLEDIFRP